MIRSRIRFPSAAVLASLVGATGGCTRSTVRECQELIQAVAEGSGVAMSSQDSPKSFRDALTKAADKVANISLTTSELDAQRWAFVAGLRSAAALDDASTLPGAREKLVALTAKTVDEVSLHCSGER